MTTWTHKLYRRLHRIICALCAHPVWQVERYGGYECGCGKVRLDGNS